VRECLRRNNPRLRSLIDELSAASEPFRELSARGRGLRSGRHPHAPPRRSVICTGIGADSTFRTPAGTTCWVIARNPAASPPGRSRNCERCQTTSDHDAWWLNLFLPLAGSVGPGC